MNRLPNQSAGLWRNLFSGASEDEIKPTREDRMIANDPEDDDVTGFSQRLALENLRTSIGSQIDNVLSKIKHEEDN
jgi:hypothetical protein